MAHLDAYLDKCPGFAWQGAPEFYTTVVTLRNKRSRRNANWASPRWRFTVPFNNTFPESYRQILDMFRVCRGRLHAFRVRNWLNYQATAWQFGTGDGTTDEFQLGELITVDGVEFLDEIFALSLDPDAPTPTVSVNGSPVSATFNTRTGRVLFDSPPANDAVLTWTGWFDYWVRFMADDFPAAIDNKSSGEFILNYQAELEQTEAPDEDFES